MTTLQISAKKLDPRLNYKPFKTTNLNKPTAFINQNPKEEVREKNLNKLKAVGLLPLLIGLPKTTFASELMEVSTDQTLDPSTILSAEAIMEWGTKIAMGSVALGVSASMVFLSLAGILRMIRRRESSQEWRRDIINGLIQVLVAVPITFSLWHLATTLFANLNILEGLF